MPKETGLEGLIPKIYKRNALALMLYGYVKGVRAALHTVTIEQAVTMFKEDFCIDDDDLNDDTATSIYTRMQREEMILKRSK